METATIVCLSITLAGSLVVGALLYRLVKALVRWWNAPVPDPRSGLVVIRSGRQLPDCTFPPPSPTRVQRDGELFVVIRGQYKHPSRTTPANPDDE